MGSVVDFPGVVVRGQIVGLDAGLRLRGVKEEDFSKRMDGKSAKEAGETIKDLIDPQKDEKFRGVLLPGPKKITKVFEISKT